MTYTHLTRDERCQIAILVKAGHDQSQIAEVMKRHRSTISRELRRNRGQRGYWPKQAHEFSQARLRTIIHRVLNFYVPNIYQDRP